MYFLYILECSDKTFYAGITTDLERRVKEHNVGRKGAKYTYARRPVKLIYFRKFKNRSTALQEEYKVKQLSRKQKTELVKSSRVNDFRLSDKIDK